MQNDEFRDVLNISDYRNHRCNGYILSAIVDRVPVKAKRGSPKKKNAVVVDPMVTATTKPGVNSTKPAVKRRAKLKNCSSNADDVINGVVAAAAAGNAVFKNNEPFISPYAKSSTSLSKKLAFDSIHPSLRDNVEPNFKYSPVSKSLKLLTETNDISYSSPLFNHSNESSSKVVQKSNNVSCRKLAKLDDSKIADPLPSYLSATTTQFQFKLPSSTSTSNSSSLYNFAERVESKLVLSGGGSVKEASKGTTHLPDMATTTQGCESKLFLRVKRRRRNPKKWRMDNGTRHEALQRIQDCLELQENLQRDLYPLNLGETGDDPSDSESSSEECAQTFQNHWFQSLSTVEFDDVKRNLRLSRLYNDLRRQLYQIKQNKCKLPVLSEEFMRPFVEVAETNPVAAAACLNEKDQLPVNTVEPLILVKKKCAVDECKNVALPCMPTCVRHVLLCDKQMLFEQCRVQDSNSSQCDRPVLNIKYHYPICSIHSKPDFVLPDFSRDEIQYEDARHTDASSISPAMYKTDVELINASSTPLCCPPSTSSKSGESKKRANNSNAKQQSNARSTTQKEKREKKPPAERKELKTMPPKCDELKVKIQSPAAIPAAMKTSGLNAVLMPIKPKETNHAASCVIPPPAIKEQTNVVPPPLVPEVNQTLLPEWVSLATDGQLVDAKTLESTLQNEFVNGFEINASAIQSQIQDIINSDTSLSTNMLMGSQELPNYIEVEEMIEEVEITDETLDPSELGNQELVHSEDFNAVLKQLPPEAFNELFSEFTLSEG